MQIITETHSIDLSSEANGAVFIVLSSLTENEADPAAVLTNAQAFRLFDGLRATFHDYRAAESISADEVRAAGNTFLYRDITGRDFDLHLVFIGDDGQRADVRLNADEARTLGDEIEFLARIWTSELAR